MNSFIKVIRNSTLYTFGDLVHRGSAIILLPFYTYFLSPKEFGLVTIFLVFSSFISGFISLNIHTALIRFLREDSENENLNSEIISAVIMILVLSSIIFFLVGHSLIFFLKNNFEMINKFYDEIFLSIIIISLISSFEIFQRILIASEKPKNYVFNQLSNFFIYALVTFSLLKLDYGHFSLLYGSICSYLIFYIRLIFFYKSNYKFKLNKKILISLLSYSTKLLPNRAMGLAPNTFDRMILATVSEALVAIYSIGLRFGESISYLTDGFLKAYQVWFFDALNQYEKMKKKITAINIKITIINCCIATCLSLIAKDLILLLLHPSYYDSYQIVYIAAFYVVIRNVNNMDYNFIRYQIKKIYLINFSTFLFIASSFIMMFLLKDGYGIFGIIYSLLIGKFISMIFTIFIIYKHLGYKDKSLIINPLIIILFFLINFILNQLSILILYKIILIFLIIFFIFKIYTQLKLINNF